MRVFRRVLAGSATMFALCGAAGAGTTWEELRGMAGAEVKVPEVVIGLPGSSERDLRAPLHGEELQLWHGLIVEAADNGMMFKHPPVTTLAKGAGFAVEGTHYVFAFYPVPGPERRVRVLLYESDCDFLLYIRRGVRGGCKDWKWAAYEATDEGALEQGWRSGDDGPTSLAPTDVEVAAAFLRLRRIFLEKAGTGPS